MICFQKCYYAGGPVSVPRIENLDAKRAHHEPRLAVHGLCGSHWLSAFVLFAGIEVRVRRA
eukprot:5827115-Pleurochrysis_carterae.AAC.1